MSAVLLEALEDMMVAINDVQRSYGCNDENKGPNVGFP